jgi:putative SOS response-associated peptidase YedK
MCFSVEVEKDIKKLAADFRAQVIRQEYLALQELLQDPRFKFKTPGDDGRVFPNTFAPVLRMTQGQRILSPMRYRIRPAGSKEEIPTKFNVFNARLDSLTTRNTWRPLLGRKHGALRLRRFFEWVPGETGKPRLIAFTPEDGDMLVPCLFDEWVMPDGGSRFFSFAIITTDPPPDVLAKGHDRCPIFLKEEHLEDWLLVQDQQRALSLLSDVRESRFTGTWA